MKKLILLLATVLVAIMGANAQFTESENWTWGEKGWEYIGDAMEDTSSIDFTTWTADSLPKLFREGAWYMNGSTKTENTSAHEDILVEKCGLGFYKYAFYGERSLTKKGEAVANPINCIYTSGMSMDDAYVGVAPDANDSCFRNNGISSYKRPAIYIPAFKYGIKQIRITLAVNHSNRSFSNQTLAYMPDQQGNDSLYWRTLDNLIANAGKSIYDEYVIEMNTQEETMATKVLSYASTDLPFILNIQVIPQQKLATGFNPVFSTLTCRAVQHGVILTAQENANINIYNVTGAIIAKANVLPNQSEFVALPNGFYIVNGTKVVVR